MAEMLHRRRADICCLQEVRFKNNGTTTVGCGEEKYKIWYSGNEEGTNGVAILISYDMFQNVVEVIRYNDRLMKVKLVIGECIYHVFSGYAPQVGRSAEEKLEFMEKLEDEVAAVPDSEGIFIGADMNCHIGGDRAGYEDVMGSHGFGISNDEGIKLLDLCKNHSLKLTSTYFKKETEKKITYKSGDSATQIDFVIFKPMRGLRAVDCKVILRRLE